MHNTRNDVVEITGWDLTLDDIKKVVFNNYKVWLNEEVYKRLRETRRFIEDVVAREEVYYGITTGFGAFAGRIISKEDAEKLQLNMLRSHSVGVGPYANKEIIRATLLIRLNTLARGNSGVRPELLELFVAFLNKNVIPRIPMKGSVGASGDLAPLSHMALALIGDPSASIEYKGREYTGAELKEILYNDIYRDLPNKEKILPKDPDFEDPNPLVKLSYKEGLALNNGTAFSAGILSVIIIRLLELVKLIDATLALTMEGFCGFIDAFNPILFSTTNYQTYYDSRYAVAYNVRLLTGYEENLKQPELMSKFVRSSEDIVPLKDLITDVQIFPENNTLAFSLDRRKLILHGAMNRERIKNIIRRIIQNANINIVGTKYQVRIEVHVKDLDELKKLEEFLLKLKDGRVTLKWREIGFVQDPYSIRCAPQVHGSLRDALSWSREILEKECLSSCDNPLIFKIKGTYRVISGGNFHGQALGLVSDTLAIAIATISNIIERRISLLLDSRFNNGLPLFLVGDETRGGLNSGLMLIQYTAASLSAENRALANPRSVHSIPTSANQEDHVSMSTNAAIRLLTMLENLEYLLAIELITATQAVTLRARLGGHSKVDNLLGFGTRWLFMQLNELLGHYERFPLLEDKYLKSYIDTVVSHLMKLYNQLNEKLTRLGYTLR